MAEHLALTALPRQGAAKVVEKTIVCPGPTHGSSTTTSPARLPNARWLFRAILSFTKRTRPIGANRSCADRWWAPQSSHAVACDVVAATSFAWRAAKRTCKIRTFN